MLVITQTIKQINKPMEKEISKLDIKQKLEYYYELDLNNCIMTHKEWIGQLSEALTNEDYLKNFLKEFEQYKNRNQ